MLNINNNIGKINFKKNETPKYLANVQYSADQFLADSIKLEEKRVNGDFISKNLGSLTALYGGCSALLLTELICLGVVKNKKKNGITAEARRILNKKIAIVLSCAITLATGITVAVQKWQNKMIAKGSSLPEEYMGNFGQDTSAKLSEDNFRSMSLAASYNQLNGVIEINKNYLHDPIGKLFVKKYMKHELQHARQFEMIAALDNGIEKLNYAIFKNTARFMKNNPFAFAQIQNVIRDVNNDNTGKYDNLKFSNSGAHIDFKDYIKGIDILLNNENAEYDELPMIVDVEHYKKAIEKRGPLSEEEKIKAEEYYQAMLKYPAMTGINLLNPFSGYRSNILEKEARKASRSKTGKI